MSKDEETVYYSDYISAISNTSLTYSLFAGFTFTAITILLTLHSDQTQILALVTLFFLATLFHLLRLLLSFNEIMIYRCVRIAPPLPPNTRIVNAVEYLVWWMMDGSIIMLFLLWNLFYLALANGIVNGLLFTFGYYKVHKQIEEIYRKTITRK